MFGNLKPFALPAQDQETECPQQRLWNAARRDPLSSPSAEGMRCKTRPGRTRAAASSHLQVNALILHKDSASALGIPQRFVAHYASGDINRIAINQWNW